MRLTSLPLFLLAAGCSEYTLGGGEEPDPTPEDSDGPAVDSDGPDTDPALACPDPDLDGREIAVDESCQITTEVGTFTPIIEWTDSSAGPSVVTPTVANLTDDDGDGDIDGDDTPDIVVMNVNGMVAVLSGDGSGAHWRRPGGVGEYPATVPATPAIGDLDGDGRPEIVIAAQGGTRALHSEDGSTLWSAAPYSGALLPDCGALSIHDMDADGDPEVILGSRILDGQTGATLGQGTHGEAGAFYNFAPVSVVADVDLDGQMEVIVGNAAYDIGGGTIWYEAVEDGYPAVANLDGDPEGEIVVSGWGTVRLHDTDGTILWTRAGALGPQSGPPTIADFDGDGEPEIGVAGHGQYMVFEADGTDVWRMPITDSSSGYTGSSVFDFEGDGSAEVVFADEQDVWVFDGATGAVKMRETRHASPTCSEYPSVADVDNDGHAEIVYTSYPFGFGTETGVTVLGDKDDSWRPGPKIWNQHAFYVTNIEEDGTVPTAPAPNWATHNTFRSGDLGAGGTMVSADAVIELTDVCAIECESGRLEVVVIVGNGGLEELPAGVAISLYTGPEGSETLLETRTTAAPLAPGASTDGLLYELDPAEVLGDRLVFRADDDGGVGSFTECHEDNNVLVVDEGLCP
jgi:hypothetical protein